MEPPSRPIRIIDEAEHFIEAQSNRNQRQDTHNEWAVRNIHMVRSVLLLLATMLGVFLVCWTWGEIDIYRQVEELEVRIEACEKGGSHGG